MICSLTQCGFCGRTPFLCLSAPSSLKAFCLYPGLLCLPASHVAWLAFSRHNLRCHWHSSWLLVQSLGRPHTHSLFSSALPGPFPVAPVYGTIWVRHCLLRGKGKSCSGSERKQWGLYLWRGPCARETSDLFPSWSWWCVPHTGGGCSGRDNWP